MSSQGSSIPQHFIWRGWTALFCSIRVQIVQGRHRALNPVFVCVGSCWGISFDVHAAGGHSCDCAESLKNNFYSFFSVCMLPASFMFLSCFIWFILFYIKSYSRLTILSNPRFGFYIYITSYNCNRSLYRISLQSTELTVVKIMMSKTGQLKYLAISLIVDQSKWTTTAAVVSLHFLNKLQLWWKALLQLWLVPFLFIFCYFSINDLGYFFWTKEIIYLEHLFILFLLCISNWWAFVKLQYCGFFNH